jgi:ABC-2 type transport system permease protein
VSSSLVELPPPTFDAPRGSAWSALFYLYGRSTLNRLTTQLARLRSPRYLLALLLGVGYFYLAIGRGTFSADRDQAIRAFSPDWVAFGYALFILAPWVLYARVPQLAIAFTPAEVQWLLPAPLTRRELINAKLLKSQLGILINVLVFLVLLRGEVGTAAPWMRAIGLYLIFSTQTLHGLGAALTRAEIANDRGRGAKRLRVPLAVLGTVLTLLVVAVVMALPALRSAAAHPGGLIAAFGDVLRSTPARLALLPVRVLIAPLFADSFVGWLKVVPLAAIIPALHYLWVVRTNVAFEEIATDASARMAVRTAQRQTSGLNIPAASKPLRFPSLAVTGRAETAILWKNLAAAVRIGGLAFQLLIFTGGLVVLGVLLVLVGGESGDVLLGVGTAWLAMFLLIGPIWNRFDLRLDLPRLAILRSWPISGARIVGTMIAGTTLMHVAMTWALILLLTALAFYTLESSSPATIVRVAVTVAVLVPSVSTLMFTVQNAAALLFPAWVRTGPQQRGLEAIGQNLLTMLATLVLVALGVFYPGFVVLVVTLFLWHPLGGAWALVPALVAGFGVVLLQLIPTVRALGQLFERTEPRDVATDG